jgi:hypothetical protein
MPSMLNGKTNNSSKKKVPWWNFYAVKKRKLNRHMMKILLETAIT